MRVMCRRRPECCPLERSEVDGESSLLSYAADECYSAEGGAVKSCWRDAERSLSFGREGNGEGQGRREAAQMG